MRGNRYTREKAARRYLCEKQPTNATDPMAAIKTITAFVAPYSVFLAVLYLIGYWQTFDINIFQYVGITDILSSALLPLTLILLTSVISLLMANTHNAIVIKALEDMPESEFSVKSSVGWKIFKQFVIIIYAFFCVFLISTDWKYKWPILPLTLTIPVAFIIPVHRVKFIPSLSSGWNKSLIILIFVLMPLSYCIGWKLSDNIKKGKIYSYVVKSSVFPDLKASSPIASSPRFIGHVGNYDFFYSALEEIVVISKAKDDSVLIVRQFVAVGADPVKERMDKFAN